MEIFIRLYQGVDFTVLVSDSVSCFKGLFSMYTFSLTTPIKVTILEELF